MKISVLQCEWGSAHPDDIQSLLRDVASHIERELRDPFPGAIEVMNLPGLSKPRTIYRTTGNGAYPINLTAKNGLWSKFAYQFAHEFCHVLSGYERLRDNPNQWFHESICEIASIFVIRRMGERWQHHKNPLWASFAQSHTNYADELMSNHSNNMPSGSFRVWLSKNEAGLRADPYLRDKNGVVATRLLPNFEQEPSGWNAVRLLPATTGNIQEYIESWRSYVDARDHGFVEGIGASLGL